MERYRAVKKLVTAMSVLHEEHDNHGPQTAVLAQQLAAAQGLPASQVELIEVGAHLHDIGKLMIPKTILNAQRTLDPAERRQVETHAALGWAIVDQAGFEPVICDIVRSHHERYDGNGYPDRLTGGQIPLAARIVAICDVYAALRAPRAYRSAYTAPFARSLVEAGKGPIFDARLVDLFFEKVIPDVSDG